MEYITTYDEFMSHVLALMNYFGVLGPIRYLLLFVLVLAGMSAFIRFLAGRASGD